MPKVRVTWEMSGGLSCAVRSQNGSWDSPVANGYREFTWPSDASASFEVWLSLLGSVAIVAGDDYAASPRVGAFEFQNIYGYPQFSAKLDGVVFARNNVQLEDPEESHVLVLYQSGSPIGTLTWTYVLDAVDASGGTTAPAATGSGTGTVGVDASGGTTAPAATGSGTGTYVAGAGGTSAPAATAWGRGDKPATGAGGTTAPAAVGAGTGTSVSGSGGTTAPAATGAGTGELGSLPAGYVAISPETVTLAPGETQQFSATISGVPNLDIIWSCSRGSISASGLFEAPDVGDPVTVTATSAYDLTKSASAVVTVVAPATSTRRLVIRRWGYRA